MDYFLLSHVYYDKSSHISARKALYNVRDMKKLLFIIICTAALLLCGGGRAAEASELTYTYAQAITTTAYFFSQKDLSTSLFAVPYTYYVRIVREDGQWYYVQYAADEGIYRALFGYVLKSDFVTLDEAPETTYLFKSLTITYTAEGDNSSLPALDEIEMQAAFYGTYYSGATAYSYVLCGDSFGYILGANDDYTLNEIYTPAEDTYIEDDSGGASDSGGNIVTAVIIIALTLGAIMLVFLSSKKIKTD